MRKMMLLAAIVAMILAVGVPAYAAIIIGTSGNDTLNGTARHDQIRGGKGNDTIRAFAGTDNVNAGPGRDTVYGGDGEDLLRGHKGNDTIYAGDDTQSDEIRCGSGYDVAYVTKADHSHNNITACEDVNTLK